MKYPSDKEAVKNGMSDPNCKKIIPINPPDGITDEQFDQQVISTAESFGNNSKIKYYIIPFSETQGNCNSSTSTILLKAGVSKEQIKEIKKQIPGISTGDL